MADLPIPAFPDSDRLGDDELLLVRETFTELASLWARRHDDLDLASSAYMRDVAAYIAGFLSVAVAVRANAELDRLLGDS